MPVDYSDAVMSFVFISLFYFVLVCLTLFIARRETKLIVVGLLTAVAAIGYSGLGIPTVITVAPGLMKLGFILVLGGIALQFCGPATAPACPSDIEVPHESA